LSERRWRIRFGVEAENDFVRILEYTRGALEFDKPRFTDRLSLRRLRRLRMGRMCLEARHGMKFFPVFGRFTSQGKGAMDVTSSFIGRLWARCA
jgi:hypothetical protein